MFFYLSKFLFLLVQPSVVCLSMIGGGLLLGRRRLASGGLLSLLLIGFSPLGNALMLPLESRFSRPQLDQISGSISGIIILGGFEDTHGTAVRGILSLNEAAERLTEGMLLARRLPQARVVFSGGGDALLASTPSAAAAVVDFLVASGVSADRILTERASRNTRENAVMTHALVKPMPGERWLLVTSAFHMPRSMGLFRTAGFEVVAWPVDYRTGSGADSTRFMSRLDEGVHRVDTAVKELFGLVSYRLLGWTDALVPGPLKANTVAEK
jgi:uncharacterized SAM-binding protein YcdF (DUF218 family)